jgi:hypothetical protein
MCACGLRPARGAAQPRLGRGCARGRLHNFHLLYLFTDVGGLPAFARAASRAQGNHQAGFNGLAQGLHLAARPPVWRAVVRPARSFFVCVLRRKVRHPAALRERGGLGIRFGRRLAFAGGWVQIRPFIMQRRVAQCIRW